MLLVGISFLLTNCEDDSFAPSIDTQLIQPSTEIDYVSSKDVPKVINAITSLTGENSFKISNSSKSISYKKSHIDLNSILKVKNSKGVTNYSFNIAVENAPTNEFYNAVVKEFPNGNIKEPYVIKYVVDHDALAAFLANDRNFRYFKGKKHILSFNRFFNSINGLSNKSSSDPCPDEQVTPIDNTPTGANGNFYNISSGNILQTNPNYYNYTNPVVQGNSFLLYLNSINNATQTPTSHVATVTNNTVPVFVNYAPTTIISVNTPTAIISRPTGTIYQTGVSITTNTTPGGFNCSISVVKFFSNGTSTGETIAFPCPPGNIYPSLDKSSVIKSNTEECIDSSGEIGVNLLSTAVAAITNCITNLSSEQFNFINNPLNVLKTSKIQVFLKQNGCSDDTSAFTKLAIDNNSIKYINENFELTKKSPYNIDMSQVFDSIALPKTSSIKIANVKLLCIYEKLITSDTYKNLFVNIFSGNQDVLNVQFKVTKDLKLNGERANGLHSVLPSSTRNISTGKVEKLDILIEIDEDLLTLNSNFNIAKTILHESIHAYLTLKKYECNTTATFGLYNNEDLCMTINSYYNDFNCSGTQGQHEFMFDIMLPVFKTVFKEIGKINLTSQASIDGLSTYDLQTLNTPTQPNGINISSSHMFDWDEFYNYFMMQGLHNTDSFETEIKDSSEKYNLYKAYSYIAEKILSKGGCN
jgi:hypothetical protein